MTNRYLLKLQPVFNRFKSLWQRAKAGKPLTSEERNLLRRYSAKLSNKHFDPILKYYQITHNSLNPEPTHTFVLARDKINQATAKQLKERLNLMLEDSHDQGIELHLTPEQLKQLLASASPQELIFWHGNHYLTGAPFVPGGIPHVDFYQWGNLFAVVKIPKLAEENALNANILIRFENRFERQLERCVEEYNQRQQQLKHTAELHNPAPEPSPEPTPEDVQPHFHPVPRLTPYATRKNSSDESNN